MNNLICFCIPMYGSGANGKSVFINTLFQIFGDYALKTPSETILDLNDSHKIPNDIARFPGVRFLVAQELPQGKRLNESVIKDLTGGDTITARFLNKEFFDFKPVFTLWMYGNHKPIIQGSDKGIWRRVKLIPFTNTIPEDKQIPNMEDILLKNAPGIMNWAIEGYRKYREEGIDDCEAVKDAVRGYMEDSDPLFNFWPFIIEKSGNKLPQKYLYDAYLIWATVNNEYRMKNKSFYAKFEHKGFIRKEGSHGREKVFMDIDIDDELKRLIDQVDIKKSGQQKAF
ncbi:MAG: DNA primase family protein [Bacteroidota bacterium]